MPLPMLSVVWPYNFTLRCSFTETISNKITNSPEAECSNYITYSTIALNNGIVIYTANFTPTLDLKVVPSITDEGIQNVVFTVFIADSAFGSSNFIEPIDVMMADAETMTNKNIIDKVNNIDPQLVTFLNVQSLTAVFYHQRSLIMYSRSVRKIIKPSILTDFGILQKTIPFGYLTTRLNSGPLTQNESLINPNGFGGFVIRPNFFVTTEVTKRSRTVLNALGLLGGSDTLNPWGCIQLYCCRKTRTRLRESIAEMPMQSSKLLDGSSPSSSPDLSTALNTLQCRLDTMDLILKEYVIDQTDLESANNNQNSSMWPWRNKRKNNTDAILP
ncbi:9269_t:CDS:2 [Paraglomus occultum]|uniref:9269_t:CDS:1 n=1 Tax=Paraglomus occultum TaxID=144539 RepID=A0A9N9FN00_9GLOM|nr:9269_t:CDS:2 [Paraglomus occultum]